MVNTNTLHVAVFPWFAMGHITPFLHLSNKLAEKGIRVSFLIPTKTQTRFNHLNHHPHLIQFIPITLPQVEGLPQDAETTSDMNMFNFGPLFKAFDLTQDQVKVALESLKPSLIFFDLAHWIPSVAHSLGSKSMYYSVFSAAAVGYVYVPSRKLERGQMFTDQDLIQPPPGYPSASLMKHLPFETKAAKWVSIEIGGGMSPFHRTLTSIRESNASCISTCSEIEGPFVEYLEQQHNKRMLLLGPYLSQPIGTPLEETWAKWLSGFAKGSVVYVALGSECLLLKDQFQELLLGLEQTGLPFLARLKPPFHCDTLEEALPEGFEERVRGRGVVHGGWVQQQHILNHPSVGCFITHCGIGSMWEALVSPLQIVSLPYVGDQVQNGKLMSKVLKVAVDVERGEESGLFTKESVVKAVKMVMDEGSEVGEEVKGNHLKWKDFFSSDGLQSSYINNFIKELTSLIA